MIGDGTDRDVLDCIGRFLEEERRLAVGIGSHFARVRRIVAPDAIDPPHRKHIGLTDNRDGRDAQGENRFRAGLGLGGGSGGSANHAYYVWVDRYNTFGLGANVPIASANGSESLLALVNGELVNLRNPYPLGFFTKNVDGRIDDPNAGWKGRGLWTTLGTRTVFHNEGGSQNSPKVYKLQIRPDPLAH